MLYTAFIFGLLGSFHCVGMCGPIAFILPVDRTHKGKMIFQTFLYHSGRLITYSLIGLLFGTLGKGLYLAGFQQYISIFAGILMIIIALVPLKFMNKYRFSKYLYQGFYKVKQYLGVYLKIKSNKAVFSIGFFNGFLPCGLVYIALIGSISTGDIYEGALYMLFFGLGTIPLMTFAIYLGNFLKVSIRNKIQKAIPIFVIIIGLLFILRGLGLGIPYISPSDTKLNIMSNPNSCLIE